MEEKNSDTIGYMESTLSQKVACSALKQSLVRDFAYHSGDKRIFVFPGIYLWKEV